MSEGDGEKKSVVYEVAGWLWGTVEGGFNEQQTTSQILVDAAIGMIPVVGDVTAARDLLAVTIRLCREPERRTQKSEWLQLVIFLFALMPVLGGALKGVGRLLIRQGARDVELIGQLVKVLNRVGEGNGIRFLRDLDLERYIPDLMGHWRGLMSRLDLVIDRTIAKLGSLMPDAMLEVLQRMRGAFQELLQLAERLIPEAVKDLNARLKAIYQGEWHAVPITFRSTTREAEARIVTVPDDPKKKVWVMENSHFPQNAPNVYEHVDGFPDLRDFEDPTGLWAIAAFSGPMRAVHLKGGTRLYRVVSYDKINTKGLWWSYTRPRSAKQWREEWAVLDKFSKNKFYVEFVVPPEGLWVWEGKVASQVDQDLTLATAGQYLKGGQTQLLLDLKFSRNKYAEPLAADLANQLKETRWRDVDGVNVPPKNVEFQALGPHEVARKTLETTGAAAAAGSRVGGALASEQPQQ